jgi:TusA-related sulfurtransferase
VKKLTPIKIDEKAYELDLRGWICPLPKYILELLLPKLVDGHRLELLVDCPGAITDIPVAISNISCESEVVQIGDGEWRITLSK